MRDADLVNLYSGQLLALAADIPLTGRLAAPQGSAKRRSPVCGSVITADVGLTAGRISDFAQEVRACALGQAAAAVLGRVVIGRNRPELEQALQHLGDMLAHEGPVPDAPFDGFGVLVAARGFPNRHASIRLALEAALAAVIAAEEAAAGPASGITEG